MRHDVVDAADIIASELLEFFEILLASTEWIDHSGNSEHNYYQAAQEV